MKTNEEITRLARMGAAALIPGMQHMLDLMQEQLNQLRREVAGEPGPRERLNPPDKRQPVVSTVSSVRRAAGRSGWPSDPEERRREMARRRAAAVKNAKAAERKNAKPVPTVKMSQQEAYERTRIKLSKARRKEWSKMSPVEREERLQKMAAGRKKANGHLLEAR